MPRSASNLYSKPPGSTVFNGNLTDAIAFNALMDDIAADLNTPRPVVAGGTGASTAAAAVTALGATGTGAAVFTAANSAAARGSLGTVLQTSAVDTTSGSLLAVGAFGLGVIGTAPVLANIDTTTTASGTYSYTTGATGTFPAGVTAATGGVIKVERQSATKGYMTLQPTGSTNIYFRNLSTTWGSWQGLATEAFAEAAAAASAGEVLLGTLTTTSGTTQTLSGLVLTDYSTLRIVAFAVSFTATAQLTLGGSTSYLAASVASSANLYGQAVLDLSTGIASSAIAVITAFAGVVTAYSTATGYSHASTSISFGGGTFDAGTIYVYGVK